MFFCVRKIESKFTLFQMTKSQSQSVQKFKSKWIVNLVSLTIDFRKEEQDSIFFMSESNFDLMIVKEKKIIFICLICSTKFSQDQFMIFADYTTNYAGIIIIFNFCCLYRENTHFLTGKNLIVLSPNFDFVPTVCYIS